jgi:peptidoglycan/LPS O-acetylase OafA/YrhL
MKKRNAAIQPPSGTKKGAVRLTRIDLLKGCAIVSVILIHTLSVPIMALTGAPFHIGQAVPLFIMIAGYTGAIAYLRYGADTIKKCYEPSIMLRRIRRVLEPYALMWIVQIAILVVIMHQGFTGVTLLINFLEGGNGPGSFFIPVIVQHILIVPLLFIFALRRPGAMLAVTFLADLMLECLFIAYGIPDAASSLLYTRYLFAGALGVWLATSQRPASRTLTAAGIAGFLSIAIINYTRLIPALTPASITSGVSHAVAYLWTLVLVATGLSRLPEKNLSRPYRCLERAGRASWHIFLVQMTFFYFLWQPIQGIFLFPLQGLLPRSIDFLVIPVGVLLVLGICCTAGYLWYAAGELLAKTPGNTSGRFTG